MVAAASHLSGSTHPQADRDFDFQPVYQGESIIPEVRLRLTEIGACLDTKSTHPLSASLMSKRDGKTRDRLANYQTHAVNWNVSELCLTAVARMPMNTPVRSHSDPEPGLNSCQRVNMGFQGKHGCRVVVIMASVTVSPD